MKLGTHTVIDSALLVDGEGYCFRRIIAVGAIDKRLHLGVQKLVIVRAYCIPRTVFQRAWHKVLRNESTGENATVRLLENTAQTGLKCRNPGCSSRGLL
ncbi:MAG: hypothetical protein R3D29_10940 [Nitratireductor sp.]